MGFKERGRDRKHAKGLRQVAKRKKLQLAQAKKELHRLAMTLPVEDLPYEMQLQREAIERLGGEIEDHESHAESLKHVKALDKEKRRRGRKITGPKKYYARTRQLSEKIRDRKLIQSRRQKPDNITKGLINGTFDEENLL